MKNVSYLLFYTALLTSMLFTAAPALAKESKNAPIESQINPPKGIWYRTEGSGIIRLAFKDDTLILSGRDLVTESEEYVPYNRMHVTMLSDCRMKLETTAVAMPSEDGERMVLLSREEVFESMIAGHLLDEESAQDYVDEMFSSIILNYSINKNDVLALAEEGDEPDCFLPEPPVVHPALEGSR